MEGQQSRVINMTDENNRPVQRQRAMPSGGRTSVDAVSMLINISQSGGRRRRREEPTSNDIFGDIGMPSTFGGSGGGYQAANQSMVVHRREPAHQHRQWEEQESDMEDLRPDEEIEAEADGRGAPPSEGVTLVGLDSRTIQHMRYGDPQPQEECYGCNYLHKATPQPWYLDEFNTIVALLNNVSTQPVVVVTAQIYKYYEKLRQNAIRKHGVEKCPLPVWRESTILEHVAGRHLLSARQWHANRAETLGEVMSTIESNSMVEYCEKTNARKINKEQFTLYLNGLKTEMQLRRTNPDTLAYANRGIQVDQQQIGQGMITHGKNLLERGNKKRKRR